MRHTILANGTKIKGTYMGEVDFVGTIAGAETHTIESYRVTYTIDLDKPVSGVFGSNRLRTNFLISVDMRDGSFEDADSNFSEI